MGRRPNRRVHASISYIVGYEEIKAALDRVLTAEENGKLKAQEYSFILITENEQWKAGILNPQGTEGQNLRDILDSVLTAQQNGRLGKRFHCEIETEHYKYEAKHDYTEGRHDEVSPSLNEVNCSSKQIQEDRRDNFIQRADNSDKGDSNFSDADEKNTDEHSWDLVKKDRKPTGFNQTVLDVKLLRKLQSPQVACGGQSQVLMLITITVLLIHVHVHVGASPIVLQESGDTVTIKEGSRGALLFNHRWSPDSSSYSNIYFTIRIEGKDYPFCRDG